MFKVLSHVFLLASVAGLPVLGSKQYLGYQVLRTNAGNPNLEKIIHVFIFNEDKSLAVSVWNQGSLNVDLNVPPASVNAVKDLLDSTGYSTLIPDVQALIDLERENVARSRMTTSFATQDFFTNYHDVEQYNSFIQELPGVETLVLNTTFHSQNITAFRFGTGDRHIVFQGGIHAREWIAPVLPF